MNLLKLISSNYICVNRNLAGAIGLIESIVLSELIDEYYYWKETKGQQDGTNQSYLEDGWFYSTVPNLTDRTKLSKYQISSAISELVSLGLIKKRVYGMPAKTWFTFGEAEEKALESLLEESTNSPTSSYLKIEQQEVKKLDNKKSKNWTQINLSNEPNIINLKNKTTVILSQSDENVFDPALGFTHLSNADYYRVVKYVLFEYADKINEAADDIEQNLYPPSLLVKLYKDLKLDMELAQRVIRSAYTIMSGGTYELR